MLTASYILIEFEYSILVPDLYILMQCILYVICIASHCNFTVALVKHCVIINGPAYGI